MSNEFVYPYKCPSCGTSLPLHIRVTTDQTQLQKPALQVNEVEEALGKPLPDMCKITIQPDGTIQVQPIKYLGKTDFRNLLGKIKEYGGEYIGNGEDSYFRIPSQKRS